MSNKSKQDKKNAILVLGMHRSGTSALTRVISLHGAELSKEIMPPASDNEKGFWESPDIVAINDELLGELNSSWHDISDLGQSWINSKIGRKYRHRLSSAIQDQYGDSPFFVIKDPRICRLLPVWKLVFKDLSVTPYAVISVRNPVEVAESLKLRDRFSQEKSLALWLSHHLIAERDTRKMQRSFVSYDNLVSDWFSVILKIQADLKLNFPLNKRKTNQEICNFITPALKHHTCNKEELTNDNAYTWVVSAYEWFDSAANNKDVNIVDINNLLNDFERCNRIFGTVLNEERKQAKHSLLSLDDKLYEEAQNLAVERGKEIEKLVQRLDKTDAALGQTQALAIERADEIATLTERLARTDAALGEAQNLAVERGKEIEQLAQRLDQTDAALSQTQTLAIERADEIATLMERLARTDAALCQAQNLVVGHENNIKRLSEDIQDQLNKHKNLEEKFSEQHKSLNEAIEQSAKYKAMHEKIITTRTWRYTKPIRDWNEAFIRIVGMGEQFIRKLSKRNK